MILSRFQWYRRMRGGYWAQVTAPLGVFCKTRWIKCLYEQPTADRTWTFYPWAAHAMGNGCIDEWYSPEPHEAIPLSVVVNDLIRAAQAARDALGHTPLTADLPALPIMDQLDAALKPFHGVPIPLHK